MDRFRRSVRCLVNQIDVADLRVFHLRFGFVLQQLAQRGAEQGNGDGKEGVFHRGEEKVYD